MKSTVISTSGSIEGPRTGRRDLSIGPELPGSVGVRMAGLFRPGRSQAGIVSEAVGAVGPREGAELSNVRVRTFG